MTFRYAPGVQLIGDHPAVRRGKEIAIRTRFASAVVLLVLAAFAVAATAQAKYTLWPRLVEFVRGDSG